MLNKLTELNILNYKLNTMIRKGKKGLRKLQKYCCEPIENIENYYEAINDQTQIWQCHHKDEIDKNMSKKELKESGLYYSVPAERLIFLTPSEHSSIHNKGERNSMYGRYGDKNPNYGRKATEETKKNISKSVKGKVHHTEEQKQKWSEERSGENNPSYKNIPIELIYHYRVEQNMSWYKMEKKLNASRHLLSRRFKEHFK